MTKSVPLAPFFTFSSIAQNKAGIGVTLTDIDAIE